LPSPNLLGLRFHSRLAEPDVPPGESVRLVVRFSDYTDPGLPYMFHCHILQHEDRGMMGQFVVVDRGETPRVHR
jgi:FtsP/CotA-like multicopper oxidase with cupredoxin domain